MIIVNNEQGYKKCSFSNKQTLAAGILLRVSCIFVADGIDVLTYILIEEIVLSCRVAFSVPSSVRQLTGKQKYPSASW